MFGDRQQAGTEREEENVIGMLGTAVFNAVPQVKQLEIKQK